MRVCLVTPATATDYSSTEYLTLRSVEQTCAGPPLGVLTLAAILGLRGHNAKVLNLNRLYRSHVIQTGRPDGFLDKVSDYLAEADCQVFGFGTICNSYPLTVRIAEILKRKRPDATIVFGGPQASVVDVATLQAFPAIDFVVRGEADQSFPQLLEELDSSKSKVGSVAGVTYRVGAKVIRNVDAELVTDLDSLPMPAFDLDGGLPEQSMVPIEIGRGCPFSCTFCSTNDFFRRRFRLKSPLKMLEQMRIITERYKPRMIELTHDLFTVDRKRVEAFCQVLIDSGQSYTWGCAARTDSLDETLLELMSAAGCRSLFFGVESGSARMQRIIDKHLDVQRARAMIQAAEKHSIKKTVSLIMGYPEETLEDLKCSVDLFMYALSIEPGSPQLNLLAPLAGTPICRQYFDQLQLLDVCSDISRRERLEDPVERALVAIHPEIFPNFYLLPTKHLETTVLLELETALETASLCFRWLLLAADRATSGNILEVLTDWIAHRQKLRPSLSIRDMRAYYASRDFRLEFVAFFVSRNLMWNDEAVSALCDFENLTERWRDEAPISLQSAKLGSGLRPVRTEGVRAFQFGWDIPRVTRSLAGTPGQSMRRTSHYITRPGKRTHWDLLAVPEAMGRIVSLCDGTRTLEQIVSDFAQDFGRWHGFEPTAVCASVVAMYVEQGILRISSNASDEDARQDGGESNREYIARSAIACS